MSAEVKIDYEKTKQALVKVKDGFEQMGAKGFLSGTRLEQCPFRFGSAFRVKWKRGWIWAWEFTYGMSFDLEEYNAMS